MLFIQTIFELTFVMCFLGFVISREHLLSSLLCLEGMMLSLFMQTSLWVLCTGCTSLTTVPMLILAFSGCGAAVGLSLLVATSRTHGSDYVGNLNLLQC